METEPLKMVEKICKPKPMKDIFVSENKKTGQKVICIPKSCNLKNRDKVLVSKVIEG